MSMEIKPTEKFIIHHYTFHIEDDEHFERDNNYKYADWLKYHCKTQRLVNIIRHPDMDRNILIHYFESTPLGDIKSLSDIEGFS